MSPLSKCDNCSVIGSFALRIPKTKANQRIIWDYNHNDLVRTSAANLTSVRGMTLWILASMFTKHVLNWS